jgi:hypothetical protein
VSEYDPETQNAAMLTRRITMSLETKSIHAGKQLSSAVRATARVQILGMVVACLLCVGGNRGFGQFLVPDQQYRCSPSDTDCRGTNKLPAFELGTSDYNHNPYTINYVEYTDKGTPFDPKKDDPYDSKELDDAINQIIAAYDDGKQYPLVVVYVHGWQNNASELSGDVVKFRGFMSRLADDYPVGQPGQAPQVVGIYLAWRGLTFTVEPFKHILSYWPRRRVAKKIGRTGIFDAVEKIKDAVNRNPVVRQNTILVFAGHSFGARVLENAIDGLDVNKKRGFMLKYLDQMHETAKKAREEGRAISNEKLFYLSNMPADLVVYVNAATSSAKTIEQVRQIQNDCRSSSDPICMADPFYLAFTSTNDLATGIVMPVANLVFPDLVSDKLHLISAANSPWMHTHRAPEPGYPQGDARCFPEGDVICFDIAGKNPPPTKYYLPRIVEKIQVPATHMDPFWIFNVHSNLVNGHGDVWNPNV